MNEFQTFVHGDDLKADLGRLHERYQQLPSEELDKGLIGFAAYPPEDASFLTTRLWDKYLPRWREPRTPVAELPKEVIEAINQMGKKVREAAPTEAHSEQNIDELDFVTISKKVSTKKGSYLRFSKETILKIREDELNAHDDDRRAPRVHPAGTAFEELSKEIARLSLDSKCRDLEVNFLTGKLDHDGQKIIRDDMWAAEIRSFGIHLFDEDTKAFLKAEFDKSPVLGTLVLWTRFGAGKLGTLRLKSLHDTDAQLPEEFDEWEGKVISVYLHRHNL